MSESKKRFRFSNSSALPPHDCELLNPTEDHHTIEVTLILKPGALADDHPTAKLHRAVRESPAHKRPALTREQLEEIYSHDKEHLARVREFAEHHGLSIVRYSDLRHDVVLSGTVREINEAFGVRIRDIRRHDEEFRGHEEDISIPHELRDIVVSVLGLNTIPFTHSFTSLCDAGDGAYRPSQVAEHYNFPNSGGTGYRIAILLFGTGGYHQEDIDGFFGAGNSPTLHDHSVNGTTNNPLPYSRLMQMTEQFKNNNPAQPPFTAGEMTQGFNTLEATLDIQIAGDIAGDAAIDLYFTTDDEIGWYNAINEALDLGDACGPGLPAAISVSRGASESVWTENRMNAIQPALEKAQLQHVTVCCSSGNYGSVNEKPQQPRTEARVNHPASSPHVLAVGGTMISCDPDTNQPDEPVWNQVTPRGHHASGGGVSGYFKRPSYQASAGVPTHGELNGKAWLSDDASPGFWFWLCRWFPWCAKISFRGRGVPDVAAYAAIEPGYDIFIGGQSFNAGGTSAATPMWAALIACLSESLGQRVGWLNEFIYTPDFASAFRDIVSGNNKIVETTAAWFDAEANWEGCCGLGLPDGMALLQALQAALAAAQQPAPQAPADVEVI